MDKRERVARAIAKALTGYDPDSMVMLGEPQRIRGGFVLLNDRWAAPLWTHYVNTADAAIAEMESAPLTSSRESESK